MNILHLEASTGWGGQEIRILREAEGMREKGHTVILAVAKGGKLVTRAKSAGFIVYELNFKRAAWPLSFFKLLWIMKKHRIEIVNTHSSLDSWIGGIAAKVGGRRIVRTRHLSTPIKAGFNSRFVYGHLADFVVTTCASIVPMIVKQSGKCAHLCKSIPTGVNPNQIQVQSAEKELFRKKHEIQEGDFLVGTACFMRSWKGIDDLLKAADILKDTPHLKWIIIGGGHAERHIRFAKELNLQNVIFTGHLENPFPALASLDLFALLSTAHEGVSQAILQAAFLEKPLLSTKIGGLGEVCIDGATGINVAPFSPKEVAAAVLQLKNDPVLRNRYAKRAKELALQEFTLENTLNQMEMVFQKLKKEP
jgi:glycosyltransferase involved in cell wall biosynthesis